jgi:ABC-type ATPase involved in cell division
MAIAIRELTKSFDVLLLDCPENYFGHSTFDPFNEIFKNIDHSGKAIVFFSRDHDFAKTYTNRKILIAKGTLTRVPL